MGTSTDPPWGSRPAWGGPALGLTGPSLDGYIDRSPVGIQAGLGRPGQPCYEGLRRTRRSSSRIRQMAPSVMALSAMLNDGK